jgi:hypothetical protein
MQYEVEEVQQDATIQHYYCLQQPATGSYPQPVDSSPHPHPISKINFDIIFPSTHRSQSGIFPLGFSTNILYE